MGDCLNYVYEIYESHIYNLHVVVKLVPFDG